ncbi:MAG: DNA-directed RNA polymerase subunit beta [Candidatus Levybacteria bacterium RIFCSPHIGHO2_02_FULL_40_18]|nr:MAG: DNA-directed RNA polymerase subunit beta [Candidatus Levybacteria bacterium RIFCSPHIGHO2_01_FULL_40_58]OGH26369.1 MAG: DNA-directed RNA polymerase subunit beta [Candidatus Levybacteria bacterium RIFCSPHIGHO2_02_FULL_40_18]OGH31816.1 MAG: DNA-directed RNA polymerase subunit beta [Candidatus Levybacteria bacterium RIFCSPHIGHO2_12_FULL_40_31]OGH40449.1 MAG: DNA-directed RNA polymerase subunit beta [Candidatus Levybacteria bacterium RIFCSPLOWO2_01_FULL_40_64]OGH53093.1 MAG: DNA-directed RNA
MADKKSGVDRQYWGKIEKALPKLELLSIQKNSYDWFIREGIREVIDEISPIEDFTGKNWELSLGDYKLSEPKITEAQAISKGLTYFSPLTVEATLINKKTGKKVSQNVFLGEIPKMTDRGTFIINGIDRVIVSQIVRSPGVFFTATEDPITGKTLYTGEMRPVHGSWLEFSTTRTDMIVVRIDRRKKFLASVFLKALGIPSNEEIYERFKGLRPGESPDSEREGSAPEGVEMSETYIKNTIEKDDTRGEADALIEIFKKMNPGEPVVIDTIRQNFRDSFFDRRRYDLSRVGRYKVNKKLSQIPSFVPQESYTLTVNDVLGITSYLIGLSQGNGKIDDIDHLANRRIRSVGELVQTTAFRVGALRLERIIKEKMSLASTEEQYLPSHFINAHPIIAAINEFFRTSQLSAILDQTNPLSEIDNIRRLTVMGTGGISRERASFSIRDINSSQYSRICPVRSPEGPNIGLVTYLALYARVNDYGFLEAPYKKVIKEKKGRKEISKITSEIVYMDAGEEADHYVTHADIRIDPRGYILDDLVPARYNGEYLEVEKEKIEFIDVIPRQVVGTSAALIPFIDHDEANRALMGTHMQCQAVPLVRSESPIIGTGMEATVSQAMSRVIRAPFDGQVAYIDANRVILKGRGRGQEETFTINKFKRTSNNTLFNQKPVVVSGQRVKKGDILIDGPASKNGELALGKNLVIAYASFDGLGYEDAIVISDRLVRDDSLTSVHIEKYEATVVDTKLGPEETTRDIPNVAEEDLANLDEDGIVVVGSEVKPGDILVGKIAPKGETELTAEERLLRAIFGEKAREVRDTSLRMPHGEHGIVTNVQILDRARGDELEPGTIRKIQIEVAQIRHVVVGDKLAGRHGNKGVISKIVPEADMPYLEDGVPVDIIISPISVLGRMNLGQLLEAHLGLAAKKLNMEIALPVFEKMSEEQYLDLLKKAKLPVNGKMKLYDARTGEPYENDVVVGIGYIMKLIHMVEDKAHARSTGPYSLVTQQPLGGKAQMGGQRLGEMEVWALEAHRAAYSLQEMLTIKSDDVSGRARAFEAIIKSVDIPTPKVPESFKVLIRELQSLSLNIIPEQAVIVEEKEDEMTERQEEIREEAKELQKELSGIEVTSESEAVRSLGEEEIPQG